MFLKPKDQLKDQSLLKEKNIVNHDDSGVKTKIIPLLVQCKTKLL